MSNKATFMILDSLKKIGLKEHEALVYSAALELGQTGALQIARKTGMKRTTVYDTLDSLTKRGLIHTELKGLKRYFAAASPDQFDTLIAEQKKEFDLVLPDLLALYKLKGSKSQIKYYEGLDGVKTVYDSILREIRSGDPYYVFGKQENWQKLDFPWLESFIDRRARKNLDTRIIFEDSERGRLNKKMEGAWNQKVRLIDQPLDADIIICPQRYILHDFTHPITTIVIENESIIKNQLQLFRYIWDTLPE